MQITLTVVNKTYSSKHSALDEMQYTIFCLHFDVGGGRVRVCVCMCVCVHRAYSRLVDVYAAIVAHRLFQSGSI